MRVVAVIAAGGRGARLGGDVPKQMLELAGRTLLQRSVDAFAAHPRIDALVVALPPDLADPPPEWLLHVRAATRIVAGGVRRQDSVANAVRSIDACDIVVVHDAARPFVTADVIDRTIDAASASGAAVAAVPVRDTVKRIAGDDHVVAETLPRETIFLAQTPQAFQFALLQEAIAAGSADATDEAVLVERLGRPVRLVDGDPHNVKITTPEDLRAAEARLARTGADLMRVGVGYDLHQTVDGRPLVLGGVTIPHDRGLAGHSDADAVCHAVTDAILGAAGAGDIGRHFPDTDARWKDASSIALLERARDIVREAGFAVSNVDAVVIAERPKIGKYIDAMRRNLAAALDVEDRCISVKGKTNEAVDALGRGEAIAVHAVAMLRAVS